MAAGFARSLALRAFSAVCPVPGSLVHEAAQLAKRVPSQPGRVHQMGPFFDKLAHGSLSDCLPQELAAAMRGQFEWYGCRAAGFHTDAHYDAVLFGAWCLAGPDRELVFGRCGKRLPCGVGSLVIFDPFEPHAVLDPGQARYERDRYLDAPASLLLAFELDLLPAVRRQFGIGDAVAGCRAVSSATPVNAETGAIG